MVKHLLVYEYLEISSNVMELDAEDAEDEVVLTYNELADCYRDFDQRFFLYYLHIY